MGKLYDLTFYDVKVIMLEMPAFAEVI